MKRIVISILIFISLILIYKHSKYTYVTAKFPELRPLDNAVPVYYKGLVIGKAKERKHSDDYKHTTVKIVLYPSNLHLPINTKVHLKQIVKHNKKTKDYLELIYPEEPSNILIADGAVLNGVSTIDMESYYKSVPLEDLDSIKYNLIKLSENLNTASDNLGMLFNILNDTINENRNNLTNITQNLNNMTQNLNQSTYKINNTIQEEQLNKIISDTELSLNNLNKTTENLNSMTLTLNDTLPTVTSSANDIEEILQNTNAITCGVRQTLTKNFGGLRLIFGKTIKE